MSLTQLSLDRLLDRLSATEELDPYAERVLAAAEAEFSSHGLRRTSLERIAEAAGVSHMTLYRRFGNRDALLGAVIAREARRLIARFDESITAITDPEERLVQGVVTAARLFSGDHLIRRLLSTDPDSILPLLTTQGETLHALGRAYVAEQFRRAHEQGMPMSADPLLLADVFVRIAQSLLVSPNDFATHQEDELREFARNSLLPLLQGRK
jgi:TetR/AcrR family transcriptional regulator, repressor for uid operon